MLSPRVAASIAIIFGGGLGVLGALLAMRTEQPGARPEAGTSEQRHLQQSIGPPDASVVTLPPDDQPAPAAGSAPVGRAVDAGSIPEGGVRNPGSSTAPESPRVGPPDAIAALFRPIADPEERSRAEVDCANGKGSACQRLAMTYEAAGNDATANAQAARYQRLAIGMLVRACSRSEADACYALAEMHATGRSMKQSETNAKALIDRAQMLCRINKQQPACADLFPTAASPERED